RPSDPPVVLALFTAILGALRATFQPRPRGWLENLALRQQLAILRRKTKRPHLVPIDRAFGFFSLSSGRVGPTPSRSSSPQPSSRGIGVDVPGFGLGSRRAAVDRQRLRRSSS